MRSRVHAVAGVLGLTLITLFLTTSVVVELVGDRATIAAAKQWILYGVAVLIPCLIVAGASGRSMMGPQPGPELRAKQRRMFVIAAVGLAVLTLCALLLQQLSAAGEFGLTFTLVQTVEFVAGAVNVTLMSLNVRAGLRLTGRIGPRMAGAARAA
ncbi:MAG TPA: hypothetical protein VGD67_22435 [Pseudonocardiaceae bacterium]